MNVLNNSKLSFILASALVLLNTAMSVQAEDGTTSSSTVIQQRGVMGVQSANVFDPKYIQRFNTYDEQIAMGVTKGWLSQADADKFKAELARLRQLHEAVAKKGYPKAELDDLEKQVTKFNMDFSSAASKPKPTAKTESSSGSQPKTEESKSNEAAKATTEQKTSTTETKTVKTKNSKGKPVKSSTKKSAAR